MKKLLLFVFALVSISSMAQDNAVKIDLNLPGLLLSNRINLNYERKLADNFAVNTRIGFSTKKTIPFQKSLLELDIIDTTAGYYNSNILDTKFNSFGTEFQFRFYTNNDALSGFYLSPYIGFNRIWMSQLSFDFEDSDNAAHAGLLDISYSSFGGGLAIGNQWVSESGFTFNVIWFGLGANSTKWKIKGTETGGETVDFEYIDQQVENWIENESEVIGFGSGIVNRLESNHSDDHIELTTRSIAPGGRLLQLSIGYSF